jgi:hypothetical protein
MHQLAQVNVARMVAPLTDPVMAGFVEQLDYINSVADRSRGFVWRLQAEDGSATSFRAFEDPLLLVNLSVWESVESLHEYTYRSDHLGPLRDRRKWFKPLEGPHLALWWVPAGHRPDVREARERLDRLSRAGPGRSAFTFKKPYAADGHPLSFTG